MTQYGNQGFTPKQTQKSSMKWAGVALGLLVLIGVGVTVMMLFSGKPADPAPAASQPAAPEQKPVVLDGPAIEVEANELLNLFKDKPEEAAAKYNGKVVDVTGTVSAKKTTFEGNHAISLDGGVAQFIGVRCLFNAPNLFQWNATEQGETVTIRGRCEGLTGDVIFRDCAIMKR